MDCVNILLNCSGEDLHNDKLEISDLVRTLNDFMVEYNGIVDFQPIFDVEYTRKRATTEHNLYFKLSFDEDEIASAPMATEYGKEKPRLKDCQLIVFLFYKKAGKLVQKKLNEAYEHFKKYGAPAVLTFFRTDGSDPSPEVKGFMEKLDQKYRYYFKTYSDIDAVKIYLLMQLRNMGMIPLKFKDDLAYLADEPFLSANHLPELAQNLELKELQDKRDEMEKESLKAIKRPKTILNEWLGETPYSFRLDKNKRQIEQLEEDIINLTYQSVEDSVKGNLTPLQIKAYHLLEQGAYGDAKDNLGPGQIKDYHILEQEADAKSVVGPTKIRTRDDIVEPTEKNMRLRGDSAMYNVKIDGILGAIGTVMMSDDPNKFKDIETAYEEMVALEEDINLNRRATRKYIDYLESQGKYTRGIQLARQYLEYQRQSEDVLDIREGEECLASLLCHQTSSEKNLEEAEELYRDILEIDRALVKEDPALYTPDLAKCCSNLADLLSHRSDVESQKEAESLYREALDIYRKLDGEDPVTYGEDFALSCYNLAKLLSVRNDSEEQEESEALYCESLEIYRRQSAEDPDSLKDTQPEALSDVAADDKPESYMGSDPYIYITYSHKDEVQVFNIIRELQNEGIRVSYDEGIVPGSDWIEIIADRIKNCYCVCAFFSKAYWASEICVHELKLAFEYSKPYLGVHLQENKVPESIQLIYDDSQDIYLYEYYDFQKFLGKLTETSIFQKCRQIPSEAEQTEEPENLVEPAEADSHIAMDDKPRSYTGKEPYIFISYSHKNEKLVLDIIKHLQDQGFRVFYDEGIDSGSDWNEYIASRIKDCDCFCAMFSEEYWASKICRSELAIAVQDYEKPNFGIYLQETQIPAEIKLIRGLKQDMFYYEFKDQENFLVKLYSTEMFKNCLGEPS